MHKNTVYVNILLILSTFTKRGKYTFAGFSSCDYITEIKTVFVLKLLKLWFLFDLFFSALLTAVNDSKT